MPSSPLRNLLTGSAFLILAAFTCAPFAQAQQLAREAVPATPADIAAAKQAVEAAPDSAAAHDLYAKATVGRDPKIFEAKVAQYEAWEKQFPNSAEVVFRLGATFSGAEDPRAKPYLLKAVALDPKRADAYQMLAFDSERWGDEAGYRDYMHKATLVAPDNPNYGFYYVFSYRETTEADHVKWESLVQDFAKRFSTSERGAQALYWLASDTHDDAKKIAYYEQLRTQFPPAKFPNWSGSGMSGLYDAYLRTSPAKALAFAQEMQNGATEKAAADWARKADFAQNYLQIQSLLSAGKPAEALVLLDKLPTDRRSDNGPMVIRLRAQVMAAAGDVAGAYGNLTARVAASPEDSTRALLQQYAAKLGKTPAQIEDDVWAKRNASAKAAPKFDLAMYTEKKNLSLDDLHGKVVLLTFWFPGCGPCRGEFPHFENVMGKFHGKAVTYVGINVLQQQDAYVLPFMDGTKYTFIPLRGDAKEITKAYNVRGEPSNFLIDQNGRIVYADFRAGDPDSELLLQRMIESLLAHPGTT